jgi:2-C-methyl-D-erythritol 4-phosphate cytidylyltransferase
MRIINIIVAAGSGSRFGADKPKQFCTLAGRRVIDHAVARLQEASPEATTVVVLSSDWIDAMNDTPGVIAVGGGATRWESVRNALQATANVEADLILVHDGARPLPSSAMIRRAIDACRTHQGAIPVVAVVDSLRTADGAPVDRSNFRAVQTPQAFRADLLRRLRDDGRRIHRHCHGGRRCPQPENNPADGSGHRSTLYRPWRLTWM